MSSYTTRAKQSRIMKAISALVVITTIFTTFAQSMPAMPAKAAAPVPYRPANGSNLLRGASFETDLFTYWGIWQSGASRQYTLYRSYEAAFGQGSYSVAIEATGTPGSRVSAGLVGSNSNAFYTEPGKKYWLRYYAKSSVANKMSVYLESSSDFSVRTPLFEQTLTTDWKEYNQILTPEITAGEGELMVMAFGDMPDGSTIYFDGMSLVELSTKLNTTEVKGSIGDVKKALSFSSLSYLTESDIQVELPYYDEKTGQPTTKRFTVDSITGATAYISMYRQTFSGVGKVYIKDQMVGQFNYNVTPKIIELYPSMLRSDQEISMHVSGFSPVPDASFVVVKVIDDKGKIWDKWLKPERFDSQLSYVTAKLPTGVVSGQLFLQTSFANTAGKSTENRTTSVSYKIKPVIYKMVWSQRGYDQVGDKMMIYGKGIARNPVVTYWNDAGKAIGTVGAKLVGIYEQDELIEVAALKNANTAKVTVTVDGVASDLSSALSYNAKPKLTTVTTKNRRFSAQTGESLPAAQPGEKITLKVEGINNGTSSTLAVEYQVYGQRVTMPVDANTLDKTGTTFPITLPDNIQTGFIAVIANGQKSNYMPLEIIPKIQTINPDPVQPGQTMTITALGVGGNENLVKVFFNLTTNEKIEVKPTSVTVGETGATITLTAPLAISNKYSSINLGYDRWQDNAQQFLAVHPTITEASINLDTSVLTIRGYGFSINPKENVITYKYADEAHTVITPKVQVLGVYPTEDGQEIRVKILDTYHYGYVTVTTGEFTSNEANFGPVSIRKIVRRVEYVKELDQVTGVIYIYGYNFGKDGDVRVGSTWANVIYRNEFNIIATIDPSLINTNPIVVTKQ